MQESVLTWNFKPTPDEEVLEGLSKELPQLHQLVLRLLIQRGQDQYAQIKRFFTPDIQDIDSFGEMKDMSEAVNAISGAISEGKKILLYGDYDVDGTCAVSIMHRALTQFGASPSFYIPDRYKEGYGISAQGVGYALENNFDVFISLDCGISAVDHLNRLSESGVEVIICDHHLPGKELPRVRAILNPKQEDCPFLGKELCGSGVALMLIKSLGEHFGKADLWKEYLGLATVATCCDIVPLTGINRILVHKGLKQLNKGMNLGLGALLRVAGFQEQLEVSDLVFKIGPRINAAGRLNDAKLAVDLLISNEQNKAEELARNLDSLNAQRKVLDKQVTLEASAQMRQLDPQLEMAGTVVHHESWDKGIIGIVASRLIEECYRPTIVFSESQGELTGSARSVEGFDLHHAISQCSEYLERFGGHASAAGLSLRRENLEGFRAAFNEVVRSTRSDSSTKPLLSIDLEVDFGDWYNDKFPMFWSQFKRMRPFGPENLSPVFVSKNCKAKFPKVVGNEHLSFHVYQDGDKARSIPVIAFGLSDYYESLSSGTTFQLAYSISSNKWNGKTTLQLEAKDIRLN